MTKPHVIRHVREHHKKYIGVILFAFVILLVIHAKESGEGTGNYLGLAGMAVYKALECIGDVVIDRLFPDSFLRG